MDVIEAIEKRRSVRKYLEKPVPEEAIKRIMKAVRRAPSANNCQPYFFLLVQNPDNKRGLLQSCRSSFGWLETAPILIVAVASIDEAYSTMGGYMSSFAVDTAIALDHLTLAAVNEGLGTCWIGAFSEEKAKKYLGIENNSDLKIVAMTPLGYPAEDPEPTPRKQVSQLIRYEKIDP